MKKCIYKSIMDTSIGFMVIIFYCLASIIYRFSYLDLMYLVVVVAYFIMYLKIVKEL